MKNGLLVVLGFAVGAVSGSSATYFFFKDKNEKYIESEIEKFKSDWYEDKVKENKSSAIDDNKTEKIEKIVSDRNKEVYESYQKAVRLREKPPITDYSKVYTTQAGKEISIEEYMDKSGLITDIPKNHPHVISESEYGFESEYEKLHYILYADGILADEDGEIIDYEEEGKENYIDPDVLYGFQIQDAIDELYYRNEEFARDFEILKSARLYNEG